MKNWILGSLFVLGMTGTSTSAFAANGEYNFRFSPLALLIGAVDLNFDMQVSPDWTVGPSVTFWKFELNSTGSFTEKYTVSAFAFGARGNWFKNGVYTDGLYVGPALQSAKVKVETRDSIGAVSAEANVLLASCLVGYGWFWDSFNMMLGGGLAVGLGGSDVTVTDSSGNTTTVKARQTGGLALEYSLGWTF